MGSVHGAAVLRAVHRRKTMKHHLRNAPRTLLAPLALAGALVPVHAGAAPLEVRIDDVRADTGSIMVQIADGPEGFDGDAVPVASLMLAPTPPTVTFSVDLAPGTYGMRVMHDVDGDGELDANFVGMPTEPWAFSNNASGSFGPPSWEDVTFEMTTAPGVHDLRLVH
jgi:uncharacterized protein (DUF2141 family)